MADFSQLNDNLPLDERARILKEVLSERRADVERFNGGSVLDIEVYMNLQIGDKVKYLTALGESSEGWVSHFFLRQEKTKGLQIAEMCRQHLARAEGRSYERNDQVIIPVIVPVGSSGYSTHNGFGLPQKLTDSTR